MCLAGEAGLRVGEVKELRWREDVDLIARTITVNRQTCNGVTTTPNGRTRRTIPMTSTLEHALRRPETVRDKYVVRSLDGRPKTDGEADHAIERICRRAGLPVRYDAVTWMEAPRHSDPAAKRCTGLASQYSPQLGSAGIIVPYKDQLT